MEETMILVLKKKASLNDVKKVAQIAEEKGFFVLVGQFAEYENGCLVLSLWRQAPLNGEMKFFGRIECVEKIKEGGIPTEHCSRFMTVWDFFVSKA